MGFFLRGVIVQILFVCLFVYLWVLFGFLKNSCYISILVKLLVAVQNVSTNSKKSEAYGLFLAFLACNTHIFMLQHRKKSNLKCWYVVLFSSTKINSYATNYKKKCRYNLLPWMLGKMKISFGNIFVWTV